MMKLSQDIGIDLGTTTVQIYIKNKGLVINEPSIVAIDKNTNEIIAYGDEAKRLYGRTPKGIEMVRPLKDGVISDYIVTEKMLKHFLSKVSNRKIINPSVVICVPSGVTQLEKKAVIDVALNSGARKVNIVQEPLAAAIGAKWDVTKPNGIIVVDIGGGTTDIAAISLGGIVKNKSIKVAGNEFDEQIIKYVKRRHNLIIGEKTAEEIKCTIGSVYKRPSIEYMQIKGRNVVTGFPAQIQINSEEIYEVLKEPALRIVEAIRNVLEELPPAIASDVRDNGVYITGGSGSIFGIDKLISENTKLDVVIPDHPELCVVYGTGKVSDYTNLLDNGNGIIKRK